MNKENFYDALLAQDGHRLEHVRPPRDLQSWHELPISALANFNPVVLDSTDPVALRKALELYPYQQFPLITAGQLQGVITRKEAMSALREFRPPSPIGVPTCLREQTVSELQQLLIQADTHFVVVLDSPSGKAIGLVTLHDLLRVQVMMAQKAKEDGS